MKQTTSLLLLSLLILSSCANQFTTSSYERKKINHRIIAVLPAVTTYTGKIPDSTTTAEIQAIEDLEAVKFQEILQSRLVFESGGRNGDVALDFISTSTTNSKLKEKGISVRQAATYDAIKLGEILGVDVVVRGKLTMNRFMSDLESLKIAAVETAVVNILRATNANVRLPGGTGSLKRTYRIDCSAEVVDTKEGLSMWKMQTARNADWSNQPETVIANMASQFANQFPYRNREYNRPMID